MATNNAINANSSTPFPTVNGGTGLSSPSAHGVLVSEGSSPLNPIVLGAGQLLVGTTSGDPVAVTLTAGTGITITSVSGVVTISQTTASLGWIDANTTPVSMTTNTGYTSDNGATQTVFTLPTTANLGEPIIIQGKGSGGFKITYGTGQNIVFGNQSTTVTTGSLTSTNGGDSITLRPLTSGSNPSYSVFGPVGSNFSLV